MHVASSETVWDSSAAACQTPHCSAPAKHCGDGPEQNSRAGLFRGFDITAKESTSRTTQITDLPHEIVRYTARYLDTRSIGALAQTCHYLKDAVHDMVVEKIAYRYYGPPGSESRHQYDTLCRPLVRRLCPQQACNTVPPPEYQPAWQNLYQATWLRVLGQNGKHTLTCSAAFEQPGNFQCLTAGFSRQWGACALVCNKNHQNFEEYEQVLSLVTLDPATAFVTVPAIEQLQPHCIKSAHIVADGQIVTAGSSGATVYAGASYVLTVCQQAQDGTVEHVALAGTHSDQIVRIEQLPDGRILSASLDGTLKIRPLNLDHDGDPQVITLTGQSGGITDMLLFPDSRCVTLTHDGFLTVWDLRLAPEKSCVATLTDTPQTIVNIHRLSNDRFLSDNGCNVLLVWQLTQGGASYTAKLDSDWTRPYTGRCKAYDLQVLPDRCLLINHSRGAQCYDLSAPPPGDCTRLCTLQRQNGSAKVTRSLPLYSAGPTLFFALYPLKPIGQLLPDGRFAHLAYSHDDILNVYHLHVYNLDNPASPGGVHLGNVFYCETEGYRVADEHQEYLLKVEMVSMGDGRLLCICERKKMTEPPEHSAKTRFCVYDPYSPDEKPDRATHNNEKEKEKEAWAEEAMEENGQEEESPYACRIA